MTSLLLLLGTHLAFASPIIDEKSQANAVQLLYSADELSPYGRLLIAMTALEKDSNENTIFALASTHPQIAEMLLVEEYKLALEYLIRIPSTERHKLRKGSSVIRTLEQMDKVEKKYATILAKHLGLPKKINAIRIGSFDGVTIDIEVSYKKSGTVQKKNIQMAGPTAPYADQQSRNRIGRIIGTKPSPPLEGKYSLLPFSSGSFEQGLYNWNTAPGFSFESTQPVGVVGLDENTSMDGEKSLRFYNTDKTRVFESMQQRVLLTDTSALRLQCFVKAKNAQVEFRQDPSYTFIALRYRDVDGDLIKEDKSNIRLGTYSWESVVMNSDVPDAAHTVDVVLLSSVSGTIWFDGINFTKYN